MTTGENKGQLPPLSTLPVDVFVIIASYLHRNDLSRLSKTCESFNSILKSLRDPILSLMRIQFHSGMRRYIMSSTLYSTKFEMLDLIQYLHPPSSM